MGSTSLLHCEIKMNEIISYENVCLNADDPLLLDPINNENDFSKIDLAHVSLRDFETFEKEQVNHYAFSSSGTIHENKKLSSRVGRHIAKKNAGQPPKRYSPTSDLIRDKQNVTEGPISFLKKNEESEVDLLIQDYILENDLPMPEPIFEETIVTDSFFLTTDHDSDLESKIVKNYGGLRKRYKGNKSLAVKRKHKKSKEKNKYNKPSKSKKMFQDDLNDGKLTNKIRSNKNTCRYCNKTFPFPSHLRRHLTAHIGIKNFTCKHCNKQFLHRYNLSVHLLSHTGNFPIHCAICKRGFASPSILERHKRSHTGETPFQCKHCLQLFSHESSLAVHERMHLVTPSFTCDVCFKVFSYKSSLTAHEKGHANIKPHKCNICNKKFTRKTSVLRHMSCHPEVKLCKCKICGMIFDGEHNLVKHRKLHINL